MRIPLIASLAWQDYRNDAWLSACSVLALVAVIAPLLVLFGLKFGLVSSLTERLQTDPATREIIPLGGGRFSSAFIEQLGQRSDVAFAMPRTRQIAATAQVGALTLEMLPTAPGDPLLGALALPQGLDQIVLSHTAAEKLAARPGDLLETRFARQVAGRVEEQRTRVQVVAVLPLEAFARDGLFADLGLLEAAEDYRDGRAVPALGWAGDEVAVGEQRVYPAFRLYARSLTDVEPLRVYFAGQNLLVSTQANTIAQVQSLSRNLSIVFWIIAGLALAGAFAAIFAGALGRRGAQASGIVGVAPVGVFHRRAVVVCGGAGAVQRRVCRRAQCRAVWPGRGGFEHIICAGAGRIRQPSAGASLRPGPGCSPRRQRRGGGVWWLASGAYPGF